MRVLIDTNVLISATLHRAAILAKADILLTGDKDFLESGIDHPIAMTPAEFLQYHT